MINENVSVTVDHENITAIRQSEEMLLVKKEDSEIPDSDQVMLEDGKGRRYRRNIELETVVNSDCFIFEMI